MNPLQNRFTPVPDRYADPNNGSWWIRDNFNKRVVEVRIKSSEIIPVCTELEHWVEGRSVEFSESTVRVLRKCGYAFTLGELYRAGREE